jgi:hypothetical protein
MAFQFRFAIHAGWSRVPELTLGHMQRASSFSPASLVLILLSAGLFCLSCFFEAQYGRAYGVHLGRSVVGLASPETYKNRDEVVLLADILVFTLAVILAVSHKHWVDWLAVAVATVAGLAILVNVSVRL